MKRQGNIIGSMLGNWQDGIDAYKTGLASAGSATKEFENYIDSFEYKINQFKNAITGFWQQNLESDSLKSFVDMGTGLIKLLTTITDKTGLFAPIIGTVTLAFLALSNAGQSLRNSFMGIVPALGTLQTRLLATQQIVTVMGVAFDIAKIKVIALQAAMTLGLSVAITGITIGIQKLISHFMTMRKEQEKLEEQKNQVAELGKEYFALKDKLNKLDKDSQEYQVTQEKLHGVMEQIRDLKPELIKGYDDEGNAVSVLEGKLGNLKDQYGNVIEEQKKLTKEMAQESLNRIQILETEQQGMRDYYGKVDPNTRVETPNELVDLGNGNFIEMPGFDDGSQTVVDSVVGSQAKEAEKKVAKNISNLNKAKKDLTKFINDEVDKPDTPTSDNNNSSTSSKSSSQIKKDYMEITDAIINAANKQSELIASKNEIINQQLQLAKSEEDYAKQIELTNELMSNQKSQIDALTNANKQLHTEADKVRANTSFKDTAKWINKDGERTVYYINKYNKASKQQQEEMEKVFNQLSKLGNAYTDNTSQIRELNIAINSSKNSLTELHDAQVKEYENWESNVKDIADRVIDTYKKAYEKQKELALDAIDEEIEALDKAHEKRMDNLDDELSKYEEIINTKLKSIDEEADKQSYQDQLKKLQDERQQILDQISVLSLDDSYEAQNQIQELNKQLAEQQEKIDKTKTDRQRELRKDNLEEELDAYKDEIDAKKEAEKQKYDATKDRLTQEKKDIEWHYNELINDERRWDELRTEIIEGNIDKVQDKLKGFLDEFGSYNEQTVRGMESSYQELLNLMDEVKEAKADIEGINYEEGDRLRDSVNLGNNGVGTDEEKAENARRIKEDEEYRKAEIERTKQVIENRKAAGLDTSLQEKYLRDLLSFATGGYTGSFNGGKLAILHEKELVLNKDDTKNLLGTIDMVRDLVNKFNIPKINPSLSPAISGANINNYNLNLTIDNLNGTKSDGKMVFNEVIKGLKKMGKRP